MRKWFVLFCLLVILFMPGRVFAQEGPRFSLLEIDLWPEYDRPSVLVIYRFTLAANTSLPVDLAIKIPSTAGAPSAVAVRQLDGTLINVVFDAQATGDWILVKFTATMPELQLEYYDPGLLIQEQNRHFDFSWPGGYPVDSLAIQVQQPFDSSNMQISPSLGSPALGSEGLTYYNAQVGSLGTDQTFILSLDYQKTSDKLSVENIQIKPSQPLGSDTSGRKNFTNVLGSIGITSVVAVVLGSIGVALIVGAGIWYFYSSRKEMPQKTRKRLRARKTEEDAQPSENVVYCHQCGNRTMPGDVFCRTCGTRLRVE